MGKHYHRVYIFPDDILSSTKKSAFTRLLLGQLAHEESQLQLALEAGDDRVEWRRFATTLDHFRAAINSENTTVAMLHFYWLGYHAAKAGQTIEDKHLPELMDKMASFDSSQRGLELKRTVVKMIQHEAIDYAKTLWGKDEHKLTSVKDMANLIYTMFKSREVDFQKAFEQGKGYKFAIPKPNQFVKWIRQSQPKGLPKGRPRKDK